MTLNYDEFGNLTSFADQEGNTTSFTYTAAGTSLRLLLR